MALDLVGGSLFTLLYDGVKQAMVKTTQFNSLLADLKSTLDSLQPRIVEQIGEHNTELGLPNEEIEDLQRQMEEGVKLVRKFSEFRMWNYCCVGDYTDQLIELDRALRKLLEMLRLQEARDVKETLLLSRQNREKLDEVNRRLIEIQKLLMQQQQKAGDVTEALDSGNNGETVPEPIQGNGIQVAALDGGDALESIFGMLFDAVLELEDKAVMFKAPLGDLKSTLASLKPLIEEIAQHNKVLVRPEEELEKFTKQMEKGVELIPKCSKVHPWASCKKSTYTEKLLGLDKFLQRQLYILKRQVARDVRSTIVSIRNVEMAIKQIEESGVLQNQTKGCSAVTEPSPPTLGLDMVLSVEGTRDVEETILISIRNTEAGVKPIEESGVVQNQIQTKGFSVVAEPSPPTLGLDVVLNVEGTRDVEETMISTRNTEAGVKPIEESGVVQNQFETKGTKNASEDYTLVSRISRIFSRNISDTSSSAATSLFSEATKSTFLSEDDRSTDGHILETSSNLRVFRFAKLKTATRNFSPDEIIGQRGFGTVFRGWLDEKTLAPSKAGTGMMVAIKRYSDSMQGVEECGLEVKILGRLSHPNLVKLLGYCYEKKKTLLVYEFVQRGSLDMHLFRRIADKEPLSWDNRFKIAIEAARGLTFLHSLQIIHRDVKPANILLDEDYNPKITSFSLAKWGPADGESYVSTRVCGTIGYLDPEYAMTGHLSVKSDVYSFGVVLLEILTGFDVIDRSRPEEEIYLVDWAIRLLSDEIKFQRTIMDTQIEGQYSPLEALQTAHLALKCLQRDPERRPSMKEVVEELTCIQAMKEKPNQSDPVVEEAALRATAARLHGPFFGKFYGRSGQCSDEEVEVSDEEVEVSQEEVEVSGFLSNISELKWDAQCTVVEDVKNYLKCNAQASYSISSKNFVEPLIKFLRDAHDRDDVKAQRDGFKLLSTFVSENRNGISCLCEETYSLLASSLDSKVTEEVLAIMEILSGHQDCRCKISSSGALTSILKLLNSQIRNIQGKVIKVLNNLSLDREICSEMVSLDCIPKLVPFFKDSALTGNCISILKNLCDTEGARISIAETNGCIASVVKVLDTGTKEEQEHAADILLSLCSQRIDYCRLVMHEGVIPALVHSSANGTERARINSMEVLRLLRDIDYVAEPSPPTLGVEGTSDVEGTNDVEETMISIRNTEAGVKPIGESGVVQTQLETKGTKNASEDYTLVSRISRFFSRNIVSDTSRKVVSDTSSSAGTSLVSEATTSTFRSKIASDTSRKIVSDTSSSAGTSLFSESTTSTFRSKDDQSTEGHISETCNLRVFSFEELKNATRNFRPDTMLGEGGFGRVFKGWLDEKTLEPLKPGTGMVVAIKKLSPESTQGFEELQSEVNFLGRLSHPNLIKLLGYCSEDKEQFLVYEYVQRGSFENHLFRRNPNIEPLSWDLRIKIAKGAARGLAFLHNLENQVIYRDFKTSSILLDENYNAKLSNFGVAKLGPTVADSHVTTRVIGTYGYAAPEYAAIGRLTVKSDVYGFGVVLLEILTGLRALDTKRPKEQLNLVDWTKPLLPHKRKLKTIMDARMEGQYSFKAALKTAHITLKCLAPDPKSRPSMKEVVEELEQIQAINEKLTTTSSERSVLAPILPLHSRYQGTT